MKFAGHVVGWLATVKKALGCLTVMGAAAGVAFPTIGHQAALFVAGVGVLATGVVYLSPKNAE